MAYTSINDPSAHFQVKTYSGDQASSQAITNDGNSNLQPDWLWIKNRSATDSHLLQDSSRGQNASSRYKYLISNATSGEASQTDNDSVHSLDSDGFTVGFTNSSGWNDSYNYVAWQWKANGGTTSSNTDGSITSTVQANTDAGFSIVTYSGNSTSGATIGHGLGVAPNWIFVKSYDVGGGWLVGSTALDSTLENRCLLTSTAAASSNTGDFNAAPTSSVFQVGTSLDINGGKDYIAYCFAEKQGYSKFGKYIGNGGSDGTCVWTGFRPAFVMTKATSSTSSWMMYDHKRLGYNPIDVALRANGTDAESTSLISGEDIDLLSNGFKVRNANATINASGVTYIYMAFAEHPFVTSTGIPTTAR